jgi:hypothetical protein
MRFCQKSELLFSLLSLYSTGGSRYIREIGTENKSR